jgi:hypothetical protein
MWGQTLGPKVGTPGTAETGAKSGSRGGATESPKVGYVLKYDRTGSGPTFGSTFGSAFGAVV